MSVAVYRVRLAVRGHAPVREAQLLEAIQDGLRGRGLGVVDIGVALEGSGRETLAAELERDQAEQDAQEQDPREEL